MEDRIYSVTEFNKMVKNYIDNNNDFQEFFLKGELSGVTYYKSGHLYFTIKDKNCQIKCAAFSYKYKKIAEDLKDGDSVKIFGDVGFYENRGDFQILVRFLEKEDKLGEMYAALEKLKKEMEKKGLFSYISKKKLPNYPKAIGVVTSYTGAAFQDIIKTTRKRFPNIDIYIYPAKVQGIGAKEEIVKGIEALNKIEAVDLIIAGRGGGSIEDLWAFNEEEVAMAFFNSKKPIISAVGHESDTLLSDFTSDIRASTPTQAIEIAIPVKKNLVEELINKRLYLNAMMNRIVSDKKNDLEKRKNSYIIKSYLKEIEKKSSDLILQEERIKKILEFIIQGKRHNLEMKIEKLISLNPLRTLSRGYSLTFKDGKTIKSVNELKIGENVETIFNSGRVISKVEEIFKNEEEIN